jgi:hypothetical protein
MALPHSAVVVRYLIPHLVLGIGGGRRSGGRSRRAGRNGDEGDGQLDGDGEVKQGR